MGTLYDGVYVGTNTFPVFENSEVQSILGASDVTGNNTALFFMNGDGNAFDSMFWGGELYNQRWYMKTDLKLVNGPVRINYLIAYWG